MMEKTIEDKTIEEADKSIKEILDSGINPTNLETLYVLTKTKHMAKEDKEMNYGEYGNYNGRGPGHGSYGNYGNYGNYGEGSYGEYGRDRSYGTRGRDMRYRGYDHVDRIGNEYGRYMESRERYGASEETDKSYHYMVKALEDFIRVLYEEADNEQQKNMLRETLQRSMM